MLGRALRRAALPMIAVTLVVVDLVAIGLLVAAIRGRHPLRITRDVQVVPAGFQIDAFVHDSEDQIAAIFPATRRGPDWELQLEPPRFVVPVKGLNAADRAHIKRSFGARAGYIKLVNVRFSIVDVDRLEKLVDPILHPKPARWDALAGSTFEWDKLRIVMTREEPELRRRLARALPPGVLEITVDPDVPRLTLR